MKEEGRIKVDDPAKPRSLDIIEEAGAKVLESP